MTYFGFDHHKRWTQAVAMDERTVSGLTDGKVTMKSGRPSHALTRANSSGSRSR